MRKEVCCFSCIEGGVYRNVSIKKVKMMEKEVRHTSFPQCKVCSSNVITNLEHEEGLEAS